MGDVNVSRSGGGVDVTRRNNRGTLYITSDPTNSPPSDSAIEGARRIVYTPGEDDAEFQEFKNGAWGRAGILADSGSVGLGRNLVLEGAAHFLKTENSDGTDTHAVALIPHIPFSDSGSGFTHTPVLNAVENVEFFTTPTSEETSTVIDQFYSITFAQIIQQIVYRAGTTSATQFIEHSIYLGTDNTGLLINRINLAASSFFAETTINSVSDSGGNARFNFTVGPTVTVGQSISVLGYVNAINSAYNVAGTVSVAGAGFFELTGVLFGDSETTGLFSGAIVDLASDFGFSEEQVDIFIEMKSSANFSLQTNAGGNVVTTFKTQALKKIALISDELVLDNSLDIVIDNNLNFVTHERFP